MDIGFGKRLSQLAGEQGLSLSELAKALGVSRQSLHSWLNGGNISTAKLNRLVQYFHVSKRWLAEGEGTPTGENIGQGIYGVQARELIQDVVNSEARLNLAVKAAGLIIWEYDLYSDELLWSEETCPYSETLFSEAYPNMDSLVEALDKPDRVGFRELIERLLSAEQKGYTELPLNFSSGTGIYGIWVASRFDGMGRPNGVIGALQDITKRKQAEFALLKSETRYRDLLEVSSDSICEVGPDARYTYVSAKIEELLGYTPEEVIGKTPFDLMPRDEAERVTAVYDAIVESGKPFKGLEYVSRHKTGRLVFLETSGILKFDQDGGCLGYRGVVRDITERMQMEERLRASEQNFRQLTEHIREVFWLVTPDWQKVIYVSPAYEEVWGRSCESLYQEPLSWLNAVHPDDLSRITDYITEMSQGDLTDIEFPEYRVVRPDRSVCWIKARGYPVRNAEGEIYRIAGIAEDITEGKRDEAELRLVSSVFENANEGILITDIDSRILRVNRAFSEITGYSPEEVIGQKAGFLRSQHHDDTFYQRLWLTLTGKGHWSGEIWNRRKDGEVFPVWQNISAVRDQQGKVTQYIGIFSDITEQKLSEERISRLAHYDVLTDLPNRLLFNTLCEHALQQAQREGHQVAVLCLDLDHFKRINDAFGHPAGDKVLWEVGARVRSILREEDTVAHLGGDEFAVVLERVPDTGAAAVAAEKILSAFSQPIRIGSQTLQTSVSLGISVFPEDGTDVLTLLKHADTAMYRSKSQGRGAFSFYRKEMTAVAYERVKLEAGLREALEQEQFRVYYQPKYSPVKGKIVGAEALIRWLHPEEGIISPLRFIPVAEESGLIIPIGEWVLRTACAQAAQWRRSGLLMEHIAVNVAGPQMMRDNIVATVERILAETGLEPGALEIEVTETFIMQQAKKTIGSLERLRSMGVSLAIDDFGTGYSSLAYLKQLPIDRLKIDRSFVKDILDDPENRAITTAVISLGHSLGLKITAEGIENEEQARFLYALQCDEGQGYLYSRPVPAEEFEVLLRGQ